MSVGEHAARTPPRVPGPKRLLALDDDGGRDVAELAFSSG